MSRLKDISPFRSRRSVRPQPLAVVCFVDFVPLAYSASLSPVFAAIDLPLAQFIQMWTPAPLGWLFQALSVLDNRLSWLIVINGAICLLLWRRFTLEAMFVALMVLLTLGNSLIKLVVDRPRPDPSLIRVLEASAEGGSSFPSGTVVQFTVFFGLLWVFAGMHLDGAARVWARGACILSIVLVGPARVYSGLALA